MALTSRERFIMTLNHRDPGPVVVDIGATSVTGASAGAVATLRDALGLEKRPVRISEPFELLGEVEEDLRRALGADIAGISGSGNIFGFRNEGWKDWTMPSGQRVLVPGMFNTTVDEKGDTYIYPQGDTSVPPCARMPKGGYYFDNIIRGESDFDEEGADARVDFQDDFPVLTDETLRLLEARAKRLYEETDYGLILNVGLAGLGDFAKVPGPNLKHPRGVRDLEEFMMAHNLMPDYIKEMFAMQTESGLKNAELVYQAVGDRAQVVQVSGTDFGTQNGPFMSPDAYREFYKPFHAQVNAWVHGHTGWKTFYHSCGSVRAFLDDFVDAGVDIINPVQTTAAGMDEHFLKEQYGKKLVFWGAGVNTQGTLPFGTPEEVYREVTHRLQVFAPGGGFVFNPVHNIQAKTPAENLMAMLKAVRDYNKALGPTA